MLFVPRIEPDEVQAVGMGLYVGYFERARTVENRFFVLPYFVFVQVVVGCYLKTGEFDCTINQSLRLIRNIFIILTEIKFTIFLSY